jgi:hypothetical protein
MDGKLLPEFVAKDLVRIWENLELKARGTGLDQSIS